jgi:hypothetical protein
MEFHPVGVFGVSRLTSDPVSLRRWSLVHVVQPLTVGALVVTPGIAQGESQRADAAGLRGA